MTWQIAFQCALGAAWDADVYILLGVRHRGILVLGEGEMEQGLPEAGMELGDVGEGATAPCCKGRLFRITEGWDEGTS